MRSNFCIFNYAGNFYQGLYVVVKLFHDFCLDFSQIFHDFCLDFYLKMGYFWVGKYGKFVLKAKS